MFATVSTALSSIFGQIADLSEVHRARLRTRTYPDTALNPPTRTPELLDVRAADGVRLRVHAYGPADAQPVVLIHGWTCCLEYWNPQINAFADDYRIIAFDLRGHGESEFGDPEQLDCTLLAADLRCVLDSVLRPDQRAVVVAHSLGGMTLQAWAGEYPDRVAAQLAAAVLVNTGPHSLVAETTVVPFFNRPLPLLHRSIALPAVIGRLGLGARIVFPPIAPVRRVFARQIMHAGAERVLVDFALNIVRSCRPAIRAKFGVLLAEMDLGDAVRQLRVPTTVVAGAFDDMTPAVHAETIAAWLRESGSLADFVVLRAGHLASVEAWPEFNAVLARVLASVAAPARAVG